MAVLGMSCEQEGESWEIRERAGEAGPEMRTWRTRRSRSGTNRRQALASALALVSAWRLFTGTVEADWVML